MLFALLVREGPRREAGEPGSAGIERFVEAEGAWNLRRVQLALASGRVAQFDRAAHFPHGGDVVDPPMFVAGLAGAAYIALDGATGSSNGAPLDESRLADLLRHVGPLFGVLLVWAAYRATMRLGGSRARQRAWIAAAQIALGAPFIFALEAGRLPLGAWSALLSALGLTMVVPLLRREGELVDRLQAAMLAGLVLGLGLASSALAIAVALPLVVLLGVELYSVADGDLRRIRARELLLLMVTMASIAALPAVGGPWQKPNPSGPVGQLAHIAPLMLLAASIPVSLAFWPPISKRLEARGWVRRAASAGLLVAILCVVLLLPDLPAMRLPEWPPAWLLLGFLSFGCCIRDRHGAALRAWCFVLPVAWLVACFDERGALFAGLVGAVLCAAAVRPAGRPLRRWMLAAVATVLVADLASIWMTRHDVESRRTSDAQVARALLDLRESTPSAGPWNASRAVMGWCIAAPSTLAPGVLLHARRPVQATRGRVADEELWSDEFWQAEDAAGLRSMALERGIRLICIRPEDVDALARRFGRELPLLNDLLRGGARGLECERIGPEDDSGRAALAIVRLQGDPVLSEGGKR